MHTINRHASRVICTPRQNEDILEVAYSGPLCLHAFQDLGSSVVEKLGPAKSAIIRMDRSLFLLPEVPKPLNYSKCAIPAAVVVRPDQFEIWTRYARSVAPLGVFRMVFLDSQLAQAQQFAESLSRHSAAGSRSHQSGSGR